MGYTIKSVTFDGKREFNIEELTVNPVTGECFYKHQKLRATYRSLRANLQYLFTCKNYKNLKIANTTNNLDGGTFSLIKKEVKCTLLNEQKFKI